MAGFVRSRVATIAAAGATAAILYYWLPDILLLAFPLPGACHTSILGKIDNAVSYDFEISNTTFKTLASDDAIAIFISCTSQSEKTALFKYDPGNAELPIIDVVEPRTVVVSVRRSSSVYFRKHRWEDVSIRYDLGHIQYPGMERTP